VQHAFGGPASLDVPMPELPEGENVLCPTKGSSASKLGDGFVESL